MRQYDIFQKFLFEQADIRGEFVHLSHSIAALRERHPYPTPVLSLLAQALAAVTLLSGSIKFKGQLILQTQTAGPVNLLVVQSDDTHHIRGLAKWDELRLHEEALLGDGQLVITIIPENMKEARYQGIVACQGDSLSLALEAYFAQSEQLPTKLSLVSNAEATLSAGFLLQKMPSTHAQSWQYWEHLLLLANTLKDTELLQLNNETILHRLFHEEDIRLFPETPVIFQCHCSREKTQQAIMTYGKAEVDEILKTQETIDVCCEFCHQTYVFDRVDIAEIFHQQ